MSARRSCSSRSTSRIARLLEAIADAARECIVPQRGPRRELVDLAQQNARHLLEELKLVDRSESDERATSPVYELGRELDFSDFRGTGLLRHLHRAGHRYGRLVRLVRERASTREPSIASSG